MAAFRDRSSLFSFLLICILVLRPTTFFYFKATLIVFKSVNLLNPNPMKKVLPFLLLILSGYLHAQTVSGVVLDAKDNSPLPFVNITVNGTNVGTATDIDGQFSFPYSPDKIKYLDLSYVGFEKKKVTEISANLVIHLKEQTSELNEITVLPGENPAHRIIKNAVKNRKLNDPENIPAFSYKTYSKFVASLNTDSIDTEIDTTQVTRGDSTYTKHDSSDFKLNSYIEKQHLFFMETVTERNFLAPSRDNETVLANRTSGFKNPLFSLFIAQMQSFTFYKDYITISGDEYLNPITPGSTSRYFFIIEDTTFSAASPTDTVFIISFRPKPNYGFQPLQGLVYINSSDWAIQNVLAHPYEKEAINITIEQQYKKFGDHSWFPVQLNAELEFTNINFNNTSPYGRMRTYIKDVNLAPKLKRKDISRAAMTVADDAVKQADKILAQNRHSAITEQEANTYTTMDSISKAEGLETKLKLLTTLIRGSIPVYFVDIGLDKIIRLNDYEGIRLGGSAYTNNRISKWFKIGGYFGYGFKDETWKYGWDTKMSLNKHSNLAIIGGYQYELFESGAPEILLEPKATMINNSYRILKIRQWDLGTRYHAGITYDLLPKLHGQLRFQRENRLLTGDYLYQFEDEGSPVLQNGFNYSEVIASFQYVPNEKFIEGADFGKLIFSGQSPKYYFQYTRGMKGILESDFDYHKIDFKIDHTFKTVRLGTFSLSLQGGAVLNDVPYSKLYTGKSNLNRTNNVLKSFTYIADRNSFETMSMNEFLTDRYIQFFFRQDLKSLLFRKNNFAPHVELVTRTVWGDLRKPELHQNISTKTLDKGYYESGLELNQLYTSSFIGVGLGFYYRYGPYNTGLFEDNFSLKLTSKITF